ncbi:hypothetical protein DL98DRAFT_299829 [Cadophora sp. DSE1049]|nr:hypothetical protein DL98DRAFT_299829 [Cadophora sp. DSE1049]
MPDIQSDLSLSQVDDKSSETETGDPTKPTFCSTCHLLETYITTLESFLSQNLDLPAQYSKSTTVPLGLRSEFEHRAQVQKCPGCQSILKALDWYFENGEDVDLTSSKIEQGRNSKDYEISLVVKASDRDIAWAKPLSITALGLSVCMNSYLNLRGKR